MNPIIDYIDSKNELLLFKITLIITVKKEN